MKKFVGFYHEQTTIDFEVTAATLEEAQAKIESHDFDWIADPNDNRSVDLVELKEKKI